MLKKIKKIIFLINCFFDKKLFLNSLKSQNNNQEADFINSIEKFINKKVFFEIGYGLTEFNCSNLIKKNFYGYLVDANKKNFIVMSILNKIHKLNLKLINIFIDKQNVKNLVSKVEGGIFSIDIDGNDYWVLKEILKYKKSFDLIIVEYNASFLDLSISVIYDKNFDRFKKHPSGLYHGASLKAFIKLLKENGYCLIKTIGGVNAFFIKREILLKNSLVELTFNESYEEGYLRNLWSSSNAKEQFEKVKHMNFANI